jgi:hypothetical protein
VIAHVGALPLEEILPSGDRSWRRVRAGARVDKAPRASPTRARQLNEGHTLRMELTYQPPAQALFDAWTSDGCRLG